MEGHIYGLPFRLIMRVHRLVGLNPRFVHDFRRIPQGIKFFLRLPDERAVFCRCKENIPFLIVRQSVGRHVTAANDHGIIFRPCLRTMKEIALSVKSPFFCYHAQFDIGKLQQFPQRTGFSEIQILRG